MVDATPSNTTKCVVVPSLTTCLLQFAFAIDGRRGNMLHAKNEEEEGEKNNHNLQNLFRFMQKPNGNLFSAHLNGGIRW